LDFASASFASNRTIFSCFSALFYSVFLVGDLKSWVDCVRGIAAVCPRVMYDVPSLLPAASGDPTALAVLFIAIHGLFCAIKG